MRFPCTSSPARAASAVLALAALLALPSMGLAQTAPPPALQAPQALIASRNFDSAAVLLRDLVQRQPANGQAWMSLGAAERGRGRVEEATAALQKAAEIPRARGRAVQALFFLHASAGRRDDAFRWYTAMRETGGIDLTQLAGSPDVAGLNGDERFASLFPARIDFSRPFSEPVRIIHEWRGEGAADEFGWIARGIGDVDGDGVTEIVISATQNPPNGSRIGKVYLYSGKRGALLWKRHGEPHAALGIGLEAAGDVNRDGVPDVVAGGGAANTGRVYVYRGMSMKPVFTKDADSSGAALGAMFVSLVGDVDRDGVADIYATDFANQARGPATGRVYVYSGKTGETLRTLTGDGPGEGFGIGAARSGDVDGDGHDDLVVGSWQYSRAAWSGGRVRVMSGADGRTLQSFTGRVPGETLGFDAVGVGDVDGDGMTDYLVTSAWSMVNGVRSGRTYVVAGTVPKRAR